MVPSWKRLRFSLPEMRCCLKQEFKYLRVFFISEARIERDIDWQIGAASSVMHAVCWSVLVKWELSWKTKLLIYRSIYGHKLWVVTERIRSRIQSVEISFLRRVAGINLRDKVRSSDIRGKLKVKSLFFCVRRCQFRWFRHLGCLLDAFLGRCFGNIQQWDDLWAEQGADRKIISQIWP